MIETHSLTGEASVYPTQSQTRREPLYQSLPTRKPPSKYQSVELSPSRDLSSLSVTAPTEGLGHFRSLSLERVTNGGLRDFRSLSLERALLGGDANIETIARYPESRNRRPIPNDNFLVAGLGIMRH